MSAAPHIPLTEFARNHGAARVPASSRVTAGVLTSLLYALFALLLGQQSLWTPPVTRMPEVTAFLPLDRPHQRIVPLPLPSLAHFIRPHLETVAPPAFTVASVAPAPLPASAARASPVMGGAPAGSGMNGTASANGGNGNPPAGCYDADWGRAVSERVRKFYFYPGDARARHTTGLVMVHFVVRRDGWLDTLDIGKSSGAKVLDKAAYDIVRTALPLPAFPDRMHLDRIDLQLPVTFGVPGLGLKPSAGDCG